MGKDNIYVREIKREQSLKLPQKKKSKGINFILFLTVIIGLALSGYLIYDAQNKVAMYYQIINAIFISVCTISVVCGFKSALNKKKSTAIISCLLLILWGFFNFLVLENIINLPKQKVVSNFQNDAVNNAIKFTENNNIKYELNYEYSDNVKQYDVISQSVAPNTLVKKVDKINFTISSGPNYDKLVIIPSMVGLNIDEAIKIIDENFLNNVEVNFIESDEEKDIILEQNKSGEMKRNDKLILTVSIGSLNDLTSIKLKNLKNESQFKATLYLKRNNIKFEIEYKFSDSIKKGYVITSTPKKGSEVKPGDTVKLIISKGKRITVPDLTKMKMTEITKWIMENNLNIKYTDKYDTSVKLGEVISANKKQGDIIEEESTVEIVVSKGQLKMKEFKTVKDFTSWANKYDIKYEIKEEFSDKEKGTIIKTSVKSNENINPDEKIIITVSKGKAVKMPNLSGKTKTEANDICNQNKIKCSFNSAYSDTIAKGKVIRQSIPAGEEINEGKNVTVTISDGKNTNKTTINYSNSTSNKNTKPSTSKPSTNKKPSSSTSNNQVTCKTTTFYIQPDWIAINYPSTTCSNIKSKYSGYKIACNYVTSNSGKKGQVLNSGSLQGITINSCKTVTLNIKNNN